MHLISKEVSDIIYILNKDNNYHRLPIYHFDGLLCMIELLLQTRDIITLLLS